MKTKYIKICIIIIVLCILLLLYYYFLNINKENYETKNKLTLLAMFKNETMNLKVWIDHYLWQGIDIIYLIDNGSIDNPLNILQPYIDNKKVNYTYNPTPHRHRENIIELIKEKDLKNNTEWLIICDLDEFYYGVPKTIKETIDEFEQYDVIYSNWKMFGACGHINHPEDIRKSLTCKEPNLHRLTKYIVKMKNINVDDIDIHAVNSHNYMDNTPKNTNYIIENEKIKLNHYPTQSLDFFKKVKMTRGDACYTNNARDIDYFNEYNKNTNVEDTELKDLLTL